MSITNSNILCFKSSCKQCCVGPARDRQPSKGWGICSMCAPPSVNSGCSLFFLSTHLKFSQPHSNRIQSDQQRCWNNTGFLWYGESRTSYSLNYSDLHKPSAASPQTPGLVPGGAQMTFTEPQQGEIQPEAYCTAAFHPGQPTSLAEERIWDIKYKRKPQTPKSQSISGLASLSGHLLRKLCYQGRSNQGISPDFSVWMTFSPCLPSHESPKKGFFPFSVVF